MVKFDGGGIDTFFSPFFWLGEDGMDDFYDGYNRW